NRSTAVVAHGPEFAKQDLAVVNTVFQHAPFDILLVRGQLRRPGRPRLALRQSGVAQVLAHRIPRDAELLGNASDRVVVPIQGVNLFHFSTLQQGPQPPNPLAGSLESRIRWRVGHFHPAPGSRVNRPQHIQGVGTAAKLLGFLAGGVGLVAVLLRGRVRHHPFLWAGLLFVAWAWASLLWSVDQPNTIKRALAYTQLLVYGLVGVPVRWKGFSFKLAGRLRLGSMGVCIVNRLGVYAGFGGDPSALCGRGI